MTPDMKKAVIEKNLVVKKAGNVQGSVRIHFPDQSIEDFFLTDWTPVNIFARIGMTEEQIRLSNLAELLRQGHVQIVK